MLKVKETVEVDLVDVFAKAGGLNDEAGELTTIRNFVAWANAKGHDELNACPFCERRYNVRKPKGTVAE